MATTLRSSLVLSGTPTAVSTTRYVSARTWGVVLVLTLAAALATTLHQDVTAAPASAVPVAAQHIGESNLLSFPRPEVASATSDQVPVVYVVGSEPQAAWVQGYVVDALVRRELPAGSQVLVAGRDVDAASLLAAARDATGLPDVRLVDLRAG